MPNGTPDQPLVSIVTPSLNQARFIADAIESVAGQDYRSIEHLVVDGGSNDDTVALLTRLSEHYDHLRWWSESDAGQSDAVNKGIGRSRGEIIGWLNSDDFYCPQAVGIAVRALLADASAVAVYGDAWLVSLDGKPRRLFPWTEEPDEIRLREQRNFIAQPTVFMRREVLDLVGGLDGSLAWTMDWDLWIRISARGRLIRVRAPLACMREYERTKTSSGGLARYREIVSLLRRHDVSVFAPAYRFYLRGVLLEWLRWKLPMSPSRRPPPSVSNDHDARLVHRWWEHSASRRES